MTKNEDLLKDLSLLKPVLLNNLDELQEIVINTNGDLENEFSAIEEAIDNLLAQIKLALQDDGDFGFDNYRDKELQNEM